MPEIHVNAFLNLPEGAVREDDTEGVFWRLPNGDIIRPQLVLTRERGDQWKHLTDADLDAQRLLLTPGHAGAFTLADYTEVGTAVDDYRRGRQAASLAATLRAIHPGAATLTYDVRRSDDALTQVRLLGVSGELLLALDEREPQSNAVQDFFQEWNATYLEMLSPMTDPLKIPLLHLDALSAQPEPVFYVWA